MYGKGTLVKGALQQIKRCDIHPQGWMSSAGGPDINAPETWECTNITISRVGELPINCQYSNFWAFPDDMKYNGEDNVNGITADKWTYHTSLEQYAVWTTVSTDGVTGEIYDVPVANGKVWSNSSSLWTIFYSDFVPGPPEESEFDAVEGSNCPESTPPVES